MPSLFEIVPNFSEGRDASTVEALVTAIGDSGAVVLDWSSDPDHNRAVVTAVGDADQVVKAARAAAEVALERIDLRRHEGVHPRIGALDVLPFVPLLGATREDAVELAHRAAEELRTIGIPSVFYGWAAEGGSRPLSELRRGGFERLVGGFPEDRNPDVLPDPWPHPGAHPTAGVTCVGARPVLLAWNVYVEGLEIEDLKGIAHEIRGRDGGFPGLRALGFALESTGRMQISMNLEDLERTSPFVVFRSIEERVVRRGGTVEETEIIGLIPDELLLQAAADRIGLSDARKGRILSRQIARVAGDRLGGTE